MPGASVRRCAAALALVGLTSDDAVEQVAGHLLDQAAATLADTSSFRQAEGLARIQSVARLFHADDVFDELPATALGGTSPLTTR